MDSQQKGNSSDSGSSLIVGTSETAKTTQNSQTIPDNKSTFTAKSYNVGKVSTRATTRTAKKVKGFNKDNSSEMILSASSSSSFSTSTKNINNKNINKSSNSSKNSIISRSKQQQVFKQPQPSSTSQSRSSSANNTIRKPCKQQQQTSKTSTKSTSTKDNFMQKFNVAIEVMQKGDGDIKCGSSDNHKSNEIKDHDKNNSATKNNSKTKTTTTTTTPATGCKKYWQMFQKLVSRFNANELQAEAGKIVQLYIPILICLLFVLWSLSCLAYFRIPINSISIEEILPQDTMTEQMISTKLYQASGDDGSSCDNSDAGCGGGGGRGGGGGGGSGGGGGNSGSKSFHYSSRKRKQDIFANVWFIIGAIVLVFVLLALCTFILLWLYRAGCFLFVKYAFIIAFTLYLGLFPLIYIQEMLYTFNIAADSILVSFALYNYLLVGIIVLFYQGPKFCKQTYHILTCAILSLFLIKLLHLWAEIGLMFLMILWDMYAVLHDRGPLNNLLNTMQGHSNELPPIVFQMTVWLQLDNGGGGTIAGAGTGVGDENKSVSKGRQQQQQQQQRKKLRRRSSSSSSLVMMKKKKKNKNGDKDDTASPIQPSTISDGELDDKGGGDEDTDDDDTEYEIGLGDFIFFSVLVGKTYIYAGFMSALFTMVSIITGLTITLILLMLCDHALPALPIPIGLGLCTQLLCQFVVNFYCKELNNKMISI